MTASTGGMPPIPSYQATMNRVVRGVLRTPVLQRFAGSRLATLTVVGRKSGKTYEVPIAYTRHAGTLLVGTRKTKWLSNIGPDQPIGIRIRGQQRLADAVVHTEHDDVLRLFEIVARDNHQNAKFNGIGFDAAGNPLADDLEQAWAAGAAVLQLTVR